MNVLGTACFACTISVSIARSFLECYTFNWPVFWMFLSSVIMLPLFEPFYYGLYVYIESMGFAFFEVNTLYGGTVMFDAGAVEPADQNPIAGWSAASYCWLCVLLTTATAVGFDLMASTLRRQYFPTLLDVVIEIDRGYGEGKW